MTWNKKCMEHNSVAHLCRRCRGAWWAGRRSSDAWSRQLQRTGQKPLDCTRPAPLCEAVDTTRNAHIMTHATSNPALAQHPNPTQPHPACTQPKRIFHSTAATSIKYSTHTALPQSVRALASAASSAARRLPPFRSPLCGLHLGPLKHLSRQ